MNSKEVIMCLCEDMEKIELPPISEKVLQALSKQRQKYIEYTKKVEALNKQKNDKIKKYVFAAMLALLAVSVPIVVVMKKQSPAADLTNSAVLSGSSKTVSISESQVISKAESQTTLEHIKLKQSYGEVALSAKSEEELEMLLVTYSKENSAYEDEQYIYNFDSQGSLIEIRNLYPVEENSSQSNEREVSEKAISLLNEYYSVWIDDGYSIKCEEDINSNPVWYIYFTKSDGKMIDQRITMTFDKTGTLRWLIFDGSVGDVGLMSKAEAVQIAVKELRSGKYDIIEFDDNDVEITVNKKEMDGISYYEICLKRIPYEIINNEITYTGFIFLVDTDTGECTLMDCDP